MRVAIYARVSTKKDAQKNSLENQVSYATSLATQNGWTISNQYIDDGISGTPPIEMIAFSSLTDEEQDLISTSPKDSTVELTSVCDIDSSLFNKLYANDQVYAVTFNNTVTDNSGNLIVYIALDESTVIGKGFTSK